MRKLNVMLTPLILTGIASAKDAKDKFGIDLNDGLMAALGNGLTNDFTNPDYTPVDGSGTVQENGSKQTSIMFNRSLSINDKITLVII